MMIDARKSLRVLESASTFVFFTSSFYDPKGFRNARVEFSNGGLGAANNGKTGMGCSSVEEFLSQIFKDGRQLGFFLDQLEAEGRVPEFEVAVREGFFSVRWCQVSAKIIPLGEDEYYLQGFFVGLQRVKELQKTLHEENKMLEAILGGIGDAVCVYDRNCNVIFQSPLHEKWFDDPFPYMYFRRHGSGGKPLTQGTPETFHKTVRDREQNLLSLEITSYPIKNEIGEYFAGINVVRDCSLSLMLEAKSRELAKYKREHSRIEALAQILGESPAIKKVIRAVEKISKLDTVVFIQGDTGTGKELVARGIQALSRRSKQPFVTINCGALTETLLDSELFGHKKGAFTGAATEKIGLFEAADGGTIFLDEIGEMSMGTQVKLLRVLQDGEVRKLGSTVSRKVNVRVITATHRDIHQLVREKKFREDLFYRIHVFTIHTPSLKERGDDILLLAYHFLEDFSRRQNKSVRRISQEAARVLMNHSWPGNVRELQNVIERSTILCDTDTLQLGDLPYSLFKQAPSVQETPTDPDNETLDDVYKKKILASLKKNRWNKTLTAKDLNISRATLWRKIKDLSIQPD
ncbi:MAG: sigma 54-interacting transcriptional regulator [Nitrospinaceae bacterium]|nr:MAG: sigma 54-interacting transcriptional regulator [Nitrospinaceae bacterium]